MVKLTAIHEESNEKSIADIVELLAFVLVV